MILFIIISLYVLSTVVITLYFIGIQLKDDNQLGFLMLLFTIYLAFLWPLMIPCAVFALLSEEGYDVVVIKTHECSISLKGKFKAWILKHF